MRHDCFQTARNLKKRTSPVGNRSKAFEKALDLFPTGLVPIFYKCVKLYSEAMLQLLQKQPSGK